MNDIIAVLTQNIFPIFIVAGFGYALRRWAGLEKQALSRAVFYVLSPCLVFSSLVTSQLAAAELFDLVSFTLLTILSMGILAWLLARALHLSRTETAALMLMVMFVNGGNYGLTLNQLRYGDEGLARAVVYFVSSTVILYTIGIFLASSGQLSWRQALSRLWQMPPVYATVLALLVYGFQIPLPLPLLRGVEVAGAGAIPVMLLVLGMQLADLQGQARLRLAIPAISLRLLIAPVVALGLTFLLNMEGLARSTSIIEASMPPAVFNIILATEFDLQPTAVTSIVAIATLLSPITLAVIITYLGL